MMCIECVRVRISKERDAKAKAKDGNDVLKAFLKGS